MVILVVFLLSKTGKESTFQRLRPDEPDPEPVAGLEPAPVEALVKVTPAQMEERGREMVTRVTTLDDRAGTAAM